MAKRNKAPAPRPDSYQVNRADRIYQSSKDNREKLLGLSLDLGSSLAGYQFTLSFKQRSGVDQVEAVFTPNQATHLQTTRWMPFGNKVSA